MPRNLLLAVGLAALCLVAVRAELTEKAEVQTFFNELNTKVAKAQNVLGLEYWAKMDYIQFNLNYVAGLWTEIDNWGSQQSRWDLLMQLADLAVQSILDGLESIPNKPKPPLEWGSKNPRADLEEVAADICKEIASLQAYAKEEFDIDIKLTKMKHCAVAASDISAFSMDPVAAAPAPAPLPARRLLAV